MIGKVEMFNKQKGFGFIKIEGRKEKVFFHASTLDFCGFAGDRPKEGDGLRFDIDQTDRGERASNISRI